MARVIYFRLGNQDEITFGSLLRMMGEICMGPRLQQSRSPDKGRGAEVPRHGPVV
jgi:hypothetical protein